MYVNMHMYQRQAPFAAHAFGSRKEPRPPRLGTRGASLREVGRERVWWGMHIALDVPDEVLHRMLDPVPLPDWLFVHYAMPGPPGLDDVALAVHEQFDRADVKAGIRPGQRIAVGVGSRGIGRLAEIVAALVRELRQLGAEPFIVPTMGSHGGATAEGQRQVLAHLGVTPERVGAPIQSSMDTEVIGSTPSGQAVHADRLALHADGIVFVARIKPHTAFHGEYESGLAKMIAIGLGKQVGAATTHAWGFGHMGHMVPEMARVALERAPIRFGLAVLENGRDEPFKIVAVPADRILDAEPALLEEARAAMPHLPFAAFDVLVIDRIGKDISGDGADPNVTGRFATPFAAGGPEVNKQVVLDLTDASAGNANGVGTADFTTVRLARKVDLAATYPNALTSTVAGPVRIPMILPSDRLAIAAAVLTCNAAGRRPRLVRIVDTLHLERFWVSSSMVDEVRQIPELGVLSGPEPAPFDQDGNLLNLGESSPALAALSSSDAS